MKTAEKWPQLARCIRAGVDDRDTTIPFGFSTRVAAVWAAGARPVFPNVWEWLSIRSVVVALGVMALTLAFNADLFTGGAVIEVSVVDTVDGPIL